VVGRWPGGIVVEGVEAYNRQLRAVIALMPDVRLEVVEHARNGDLAFIRWVSHGTGVDGPFSMDGVDRLRIRDGRIVENVVFLDTAAFRRATGRGLPDTTAQPPVRPAGRPMPPEAQALVAKMGLAYVATVLPDGRPNLSPKGTLKVVDDHTLAFAEMASPGTLKDLANMGYVDVNVMDPFLRKGFRFRGTAEVGEDQGLIAFLAEGLGADYPLRRAITIHVEETRPLISPVYAVTGASEAEVRRKWEGLLGYLPAG
jgi:predicted pyridoxine 5'-phosphate oxidase superfamily flavin-nucleotide-binding protein